MSNNTFIISVICEDLNIAFSQVKNTVELLDEGATVPFISRYRKERTGSLDEEQVLNISEKLKFYKELEDRKTTILKTITEQGKLTKELSDKIAALKDKQLLEDLYLPYKPKRKTKADKALEKGLGPLADIIMAQENIKLSKVEILEQFLSEEHEIKTPEEALELALDIVAQNVSDTADIRQGLREMIYNEGILKSQVKKDFKEEKTKFEMYYNFGEVLKTAPSHRMMAIARGTSENILSWNVDFEEKTALRYIERKVVTNKNFMFYSDICTAIEDAYTRLIFPSIEKEVFKMQLEMAETEAIDVFSKNFKNLLLAPPAGDKKVLAFDPGFRTGCKVAALDASGEFKEYVAIFPHPPQKKEREASEIVLSLIKKHKIELIAIGNGTASKETRIFVVKVLKENNIKIPVMVVSEAGASVYSASPLAKKEFPNLDVTVRGAISIGRRLKDPLAELVKIDPKSIGVGQYQHDVNQKALRDSLGNVVEHCVNFVGVELNTASMDLLSFVSGVNKKTAANIIDYRTENKEFSKRSDLKKVKGLGAKAFEQCAGFLRVRKSTNPLDNSSIHPENYNLVKQMASDINVSVKELIGNENHINLIDIEKYVTADVGLPTLNDVIAELKKPGLDPRDKFESVEFKDDVNEIEDLKEGMEFSGVVTNVTNFGAFVDIGVHQDGLIHISNLSDKFIKNTHDFISVGDNVKVKVLEVDLKLKRIALKNVIGQ